MRFYALMVKALSEGVAQRDLKRLGYHVVAPILVERRRGKARIVRRGPLFRGYVFVRLASIREGARELPANWLNAERANGAIRFVRFGPEGVPSALPRGFVEAIERLLDKDGRVDEKAVSAGRGHVTVDPIRARMAARRETRVVLRDADSAFCGLEGDVDFSDVTKALSLLDARGRLRILLRIMKTIVPVEVDRDQVEGPYDPRIDRDVRANGPARKPPRTTVRRTA